MVSLVISGSLLDADDEAPSPEQKRLDVYAAKIPPVIDGKMDDECWKDAAKTDLFHVFKSGKEAKEGTEVRVTYDCENLYVFFTCNESQMDKIRAIRPQDKQDENVFGDDSVEVFLEPFPPQADDAYGVNHFQFAINSLGTRFDMAHPGLKWDASGYTGDWQVKTAHSGNSWTAEFAIKFYSITHEREYRGTPVPGEIWRVNFCRSEQRLPEWSTWSLQTHGFHDRKRFGYIEFLGLKDEKTPILKVENISPPRLGPSEVKGIVENPTGTAAKLTLNLTLNQAGQPARPLQDKTLDVPAGGTRPFNLPYLVDTGGELRLMLTMREGEKLLSLGSVPFETPRLDEILGRVRKEMEVLDASLKSLPDSDRDTLTSAQKKIMGKELALRSRFDARKDMPSDAWIALEKDVLLLEEESAVFRRDMSRAMLRRNGQAALPGSPLGMTVVSSFEKICPDDTFLSTRSTAELDAARNETESFQIVLQAGDSPMEGIRIESEDLVHENGKNKIPKENIRWGAVGMVKRKLPKTGDGIIRYAYDPDPIMEGKLIRFEANELRPVWVDVYVPGQSMAGKYSGICNVTLADGGKIPVKFSLLVRDFTIPEKSSLRVENWYNPLNTMYYYRQNDVPLEQFEKHARFLSRYRHPCFPFDWTFSPRKILIIEEPDGSLSFDFTELNKYLEISYRYGCRLGNIQMSPIMGWVQALCGGFGRPYFKILDRSTGEIRDYPVHKKDRILEYEDTARSYLHRELLKALWQNIRNHGWDDMVYSEHEDEPNDPIRFDRYRRMAVLIRELCPGIKSTSWGVCPDDRRGTIGYSNCWGPNIKHSVKEGMPAIRERRKMGEETWVYTCGGSLRDPVTGGEVFDGQTDSTMLKTRIGPWTCWHLDLQGIFHFCINGWDGVILKDGIWNGEKVPEEKQFHNVELPKFETGNGMYVWPAPDGSLWPSLRLCAMRDGLEDYEYLALLRKQLDRLAVLDGENPLIGKYRDLLDLDPEIMKSAEIWTHDPQTLMKRRRELAAAVEELNPVLWELSPPLMGIPGEVHRGK
ncbi:MAG: DUF4091 domain-containing protein [Victivallales bacterium]|nr:DUF4091 domain-containing protein [Victivallales bacterium]